MANKPTFTKEQETYMQEMMQQAVAKQNKELELKQKQRETNLVQMGAIVQEKIEKVGSPIVDKQSGQQKEVNGIPQCYPNKYFVNLHSMGLELETEVTKDVYDMIEQFSYYLCSGYVGLVKKFGSDYIEPIFKSFTKI